MGIFWSPLAVHDPITGEADDVGGDGGESARVSKVASTCTRSVSGAWMCGCGPTVGNPDQDQARRVLGSDSRSWSEHSRAPRASDENSHDSLEVGPGVFSALEDFVECWEVVKGVDAREAGKIDSGRVANSTRAKKPKMRTWMCRPPEAISTISQAEECTNKCQVDR